MAKTKKITITLEEEILRKIQNLAQVDKRSVSSMINWILYKFLHEDKE